MEQPSRKVTTRSKAPALFPAALTPRMGQAGCTGKAREAVNGKPIDNERNAAGATTLTARRHAPSGLLTALHLLARRPVLPRQRAMICKSPGAITAAMANENGP